MIKNKKLCIFVVGLFVLVCQTAAQNSPHGTLAMECTACHFTSSWKEMKSPMDFNHSATAFSLTGRHATTDCKECHISLRFSGTATDCYSCHQSDLLKMKMPDHQRGQFSHDCTACHSTGGWKPSIFDHKKTNFQLVGSHIAVDCASCHQNARFAGTPLDCYSCHRSDFAGVVNPNHQSALFSHDCLSCHTMDGWKPSTFDHSKTSFQLTGVHRTTDCLSCHTSGRFAGTPSDCYSCHRSNFAAAMAPKHESGKLSHDCQSCHSTQGWAPATFDHSTTNFQLVGAHTTVDCASCHAGGQFTGTPKDCYSCHKSDFAKTKGPDHVVGQFDHDCTTCHSMVAWKPSTFDHSQTKFKLLGAHIAVDCASCHPAGKFVNVPSDCFACHQTDFNHATDHLASRFVHDCLTCHSMNGWLPSTFDHSKTVFPLNGAHQSTPCAQCHKNGQFTTVPTDCFSCHQSDYARPKSPNHQLGQFSHDCTTCHTVNAWRPATFDHSETSFALLGAHLAVDCGSCHISGRFAGTPTVCYQCHQTDFNHATDHLASRFVHDCLTCHSMNGWSPSTFDHNKATFSLQGAHQSVPCASCHKNGQFAGIPTDCYSCHSKDFAVTVNPNHQVSGFSHDCTTCHTMMAWRPSTFDHSKTSFALLGAHLAVDCGSCHISGRFAGTPTVCYQCHQTDFNHAPDHLSAQFNHDCLTCHSMNGWSPSTFDHNKTTFSLQGAHQSVPCASCHKNGQFAGIPTDCYSCHSKDFAATLNPNHQVNAFSHDCVTCHSLAAWKPSTFNHANTSFPLTGAHTTTDCLFCHKGGQFKGLPSDCYSCHQVDFAGVADPNHVAANFDHNCATCHTTQVWRPATFDHSTTNFKLTGTHATTECARCHVNNRFAGTPTDCFSCHQQDYNGATNPNHTAAAYPVTCASCHTTTAWQPATFDHTPFFPINAGSHHSPGRWTFCSDCHTNPSSPATFECINCHTHNKTTTDGQHRNRTGYLYQSASCYRCHPRG